MKTVFEVKITMESDTAESQHEMQQDFLERLPSKGGNAMLRTKILVEIELESEKAPSLYDMQQTFLEKLPEKFGPDVDLFSARIVGGQVNKDDAPVKKKAGI